MEQQQLNNQNASAVWMVRPALFGFNAETAASNSFQHDLNTEIQALALAEFDRVVEVLRSKAIDVFITQSTDALAPDAIFPNNWFSTHSNGLLVLYPMMALNRRRERISELLAEVGRRFSIHQTVDLSYFEPADRFLEGTGSIVFDHEYKIAYAVLSPRTDAVVLNELCNLVGYTPFLFHSFDSTGAPVYHTNVVMHIGKEYAVICADSIPDPAERAGVMELLSKCGKEVISISQDQMENFCGNMLQLKNAAGKLFTICSGTAYNSFTEMQRKQIEKFSELLVVDIPIIERVGGGGVRCMLAEIFLPPIAASIQ